MRTAIAVALVLLLAGSADAQSALPAGDGGQPEPSGATTAAADPATRRNGLLLPETGRLRISARFMAAHGHDGANANGGFEKQGRVGYAIVTLEGRPIDRVFYRLSVNPVNETEPRPACGEPNFFFPNDPRHLYDAGPNVPCDVTHGNRRVDLYRFIAFDVVPQQGAVREAFLDYLATNTFSVRVGRMLLPLGFDWEDAGSFTAKDAPRIQRINAEANFGVMFRYVRMADGRRKPLISASASGVLGEGNRWWDYDYFYFEDGSLDANSALTAVGAVSVSPHDSVDVRASYKKGYTGSKVERLPSYWASKRNDDALVVGASYENRYVRAFGEFASYTWGPTATSAEMVGVDQAPIEKAGAWGTIEGRYPLPRRIHVGASVTVEKVERADSLVKYLAANGLYGVETGQHDRMRVLRLFVDLAANVRIGFYRNIDDNPFPQASGIRPVVGVAADQSRPTDKWGLLFRASIP